jgi:formylglycine-generating enzyme required for sulfatase activity
VLCAPENGVSHHFKKYLLFLPSFSPLGRKGKVHKTRHKAAWPSFSNQFQGVCTMKRRMVTVSVLCLIAILTACANPSGGGGGGGGSGGGGGGGGPPASITETAEGVNYTFRLVPAGTVRADIGNLGGPFKNATAIPVPVSAFYIGETEVTYQLWKAVYDWATDAARGPNKYTFANSGRQGGDGASGPMGTNRHPVTTINWRDAVVWCNAYSEAAGRTPVYYYNGAVLRESEGDSVVAGNGKADQADINPGNGYRLPTSAQWEYAARGGVPSAGEPWTYIYAGSNTVGDVAVYNTTQTAEVKSKVANSRGLYDMSGNVWEWCWDQSLFDGTRRVFRNGNWSSSDASVCAVASWGTIYSTHKSSDLGFRVVCVP